MSADPGAPEQGQEGPEQEEAEPKVHYEVFYNCLRCGTRASSEELGRLPEIKCMCGFRVFVKDRPPLVKEVGAV